MVDSITPVRSKISPFVPYAKGVSPTVDSPAVRPSFDGAGITRQIQSVRSPGVQGMEAALAPGRAPKVGAPDPDRLDHALYTVHILGFSSKDDGDIFGEGEWFVARNRFARTAVIGGSDGDWVNVQDPTPFVLSHYGLNPSERRIRVEFGLYDEDTLEDELLGTFDHMVEIPENGVPSEPILASEDEGASAKIRVVRQVLSTNQVSVDFVRARGGDWKRIAADYSVQRELLFQAEQRVGSMDRLAGPHHAIGPLEAASTVSELQDQAFRIRAFVTSVDGAMKEYAALKNAYNEHMLRLATTVVFEDREPTRPNPPNPLPGRAHFPFRPVEAFLIQ